MTTKDTWKKEPLARIARLTMGQSPSSKYYSEEEAGWPFLQGCAEFQSRFPAAKLFCTHKGKIAKRNSILFSVRAPVGRINIADRDYVIGRGLAAIEGSDIDQDYLEHYLDYIAPSLRNASQGSTFEAINSGELRAWPILCPSNRDEQTRIARILSTVDRAIEQTETLIAKQQRIKTGLMRDLLTRGIDGCGRVRSELTHKFKDSAIGRIPAEWTVGKLGEVIGRIVSGWSPTCESIQAAPGEWAVLKTTAVVWSGYDQNENKRLPDELRGVASIEITKDDILITRKGPVERVGVVVQVPETRPHLMIPDTVFRTRVLDEARLLPAFLPFALGSSAVQADWFQKKIGLADAQVNLNHGILRATLFPEPPPVEQGAIISRASCVVRLIKQHGVQLQKLRSVKAALMQDLLTGRKPVNALLEPEQNIEKVHASQ